MSNFLEDMAYKQYENKLPSRYDEEPLFFCASCGSEIYQGEMMVVFEKKTFCCECALVKYAEREDCEL